MKNSGIRNQRVSSARQRKQQHHLLEVKVRQEIARKQNFSRSIALIAKLILAIGIIGGMYLGGQEALRRFVWENPDYQLTDLRVTTDGALTREQILTAGGISEGRNIFTIDLSAARVAIDALPQVERVEIQRVLPSRVNVSVVERRPIAWVTSRREESPSADRSFLIDARGVVMRTKTILPEYLLLPIISGVEVENLAPGQRVKTIEMHAALDLVRLNADSTRFQARNIDISKGYCLVVTDRNRAQITFGLDRIDQQLERLERYLDRARQGQQELQTANLLVERNTPVTFVEPVAPEPEVVPAAAPPRSETAREKFLGTRAGVATPKPLTSGRSTPGPAEKTSANATKKESPATKKNTRGSSSKTPGVAVKKPFRQ